MANANPHTVSKSNIIHALLILILKKFGTRGKCSIITRRLEIGKLQAWYFDNVDHVIADFGRKTFYNKFYPYKDK